MNPVKILIIGNGFGGIYTLKRLHTLFHGTQKVQITLVGEKNYFLFTPLLHEVATGGVDPENVVEPIRKILGCCIHRFHLGKVELVNPYDKKIKVGKEFIPYDYLILAPGATTNFYNIPGAERYSFTLKTLEDAVRIKNHCILQVERASHVSDRLVRKKMLRFVVAGGGPTGVELAAELQEFLKGTFSTYYPDEVIDDISVILVEKGSKLLKHFGEKIQKKSIETLQKKRIQILLNTDIREVTSDYVVLDEKRNLETETVVWVAGIRPSDIIFDVPVQKSADGRLLVDDYLQLKGYSEIFAIGDIAAAEPKNIHGFLPALAQVAVKEADFVGRNIRRLTEGKDPSLFQYRHAGNLVSIGRWMAVGEIAHFSFWGHLTWWLWRTVYLSKLISWQKKMKVALDWTIHLFLPRDISQL